MLQPRDDKHRMMIFGGSGPEGVFFSTWALTHVNGLEPDDEGEQQVRPF